MTRLRRLVFAHRAFAASVIALAVLMKILVPSGTMISAQGGAMTIVLCTGSGPVMMAVPMTDDQGRDGHNQDGHDQGKDMPCAFSALSAPSMAAADPMVLAIALAFIIEASLRFVSSGYVAAPAYMRPHPRGPPAAI